MKPTPFCRHDSTPMPGNMLSREEGLMPAGQGLAVEGTQEPVSGQPLLREVVVLWKEQGL